MAKEWNPEEHESWGLIGAHRGTYMSLRGGERGAALFDSDIRHQQTVSITIKRAIRTRDLHHDWIGGREELIEVELSEAQWASFVSAMNTGEGVPCTLRRVAGEQMPSVPYQPRMAETMAETHQAAEKAFQGIKADLAAVQEALDSKAGVKALRERLWTLTCTVNNAAPNVDFAGKQLVEQAEGVVGKARADIEAMVVTHARALGIDPAALSDGMTVALGVESEVPETEGGGQITTG